MITVTQIQAEAIAVELAKRRKVLPPVPQPDQAAIAWAKRTMADGYQGSVTDRVDATRILDAAGISADDYHGGREPDTAPAGARDVAAALLERDKAESDRSARKAYDDRGISLGPGDGVKPGHPEPGDFQRGYIDAGHGAEAPMAEPPRRNPMPELPRGIVTPVALPDAPMAARIHPSIAASFTMGSPSDR